LNIDGYVYSDDPAGNFDPGSNVTSTPQNISNNNLKQAPTSTLQSNANINDPSISNSPLVQSLYNSQQ
jgi:hypothetical protein